MTTQQDKGHQALATPAALSTAVQFKDSANHGSAQGPRDAAAVFIGNGLRSLRRVVALRLGGASPTKALHEAKRARDAIDSACWALEYETGLRQRGEA